MLLFVCPYQKDCDERESVIPMMECRLSSNLPTNLPTKQENRENTVYLRCFKQVRFPSAALFLFLEKWLISLKILRIWAIFYCFIENINFTQKERFSKIYPRIYPRNYQLKSSLESLSAALCFADLSLSIMEWRYTVFITSSLCQPPICSMSASGTPRADMRLAK